MKRRELVELNSCNPTIARECKWERGSEKAHVKFRFGGDVSAYLKPVEIREMIATLQAMVDEMDGTNRG